MGVQKLVRASSRRRSIKARRPWSRTIRNYAVPRPIRTLAAVRPAAGVYGFGQSMRTKLRYVENIAFSSTAGAVQRNAFSPQNCFDPNVSGTGHQPMYFDQFAAIYSRYKVHGSTIRVKFNVVSETAATSCFAVGIYAGSSSALPASDAQTLMEDNHGKSAICNGRNGGTGQRTIVMDYAPYRDTGISVNDDTMVTPTTSGAATYFWNVWAADLQATGTTSLIASVEIIFDVEFTDNLNITGS